MIIQKYTQTVVDTQCSCLGNDVQFIVFTINIHAHARFICQFFGLSQDKTLYIYILLYCLNFINF